MICKSFFDIRATLRYTCGVLPVEDVSQNLDGFVHVTVIRGANGLFFDSSSAFLVLPF